MPADYASTARALALPISPDRTPSPSFLRPPWHTHRRSTSSARRGSGFSTQPSNLRDSLLYNSEKLGRRVIATYQKLTVLQRILVAFAFITALVLGILFLVFSEQIFQWLKPYAQRWKDTPGGWTILWAATFITAFPPMIGYSTCGTLAGFVYGVREGWLILATATVAGSTCSLIVSRTIFKGYVERMVAGDTRFAALTLTIKQDGLKLLCMIRLCPIPYSFSNGAMSTFPTVQPAMYALATAIVSPKLLIPAFIGSRIAAIVGNEGQEMSAGTKAVNWISIIGGAFLGAFTGWYIYKKTMARARELEAEEERNVGNTNARTGAPPPEFTDDPNAQRAVGTVLRDEGDEENFVDEGASPVTDEYRDDFTDDEDIFGRGDGDEEQAIGLHKQHRPSA